MLVTLKKAMKNWLGGFELLTFSKATTHKDGVVAIMQTGAKSLSKYGSLNPCYILLFATVSVKFMMALSFLPATIANL